MRQLLRFSAATVKTDVFICPDKMFYTQSRHTLNALAILFKKIEFYLLSLYTGSV